MLATAEVALDEDTSRKALFRFIVAPLVLAAAPPPKAIWPADQKGGFCADSMRSPVIVTGLSPIMTKGILTVFLLEIKMSNKLC